jgi:hypothetical protein
LPTAAYFNYIVLGLGVLSWSLKALYMTFALISSLSVDGNLNAQRYPDEILARHIIPQNDPNMNIIHFNMVMQQAIQIETL